MKDRHRSGSFLLFLGCGLVVFVVFSHFFPIFERKVDIIGRVIAGLALLIAALAARRSERFGQYWLVLFAFFTALTAISIDRYVSLSRWILPALGMEGDSPAGLTITVLSILHGNTPR